MAKSLATLITEVETILGDTTNAVWSEAEITAYIKEGYDDLCLRTELLWKKASPSGLDDVSRQATYSLPTDLYKIERLTWNRIRLQPVNTAELERRDTQFRTQTGSVYAYAVDGDGIGILRKIRVPSASEAGTTSIEYVRRGATLSLTTTEVEIPDTYAKYVRFFALARCFERDGPGQKPKQADHYQTRYDEGLARIRNRKSAARKARVGRMGRGGAGESPLMSGRLPWAYGRTP